MAQFRAPRFATLIAIAVVAVLGAVVGILALAAYQSTQGTASTATAAPVPTFTLGVQTQTPTPTPTPTPEVERSEERFLSVGAGVFWRAVAGACGGADAVIERSTNDGDTWSDVTPDYLDIAQVASLDAMSDGAEMVGGFGSDCKTLAMRSFTAGEFWESYPTVLDMSRYVDVTDPSIVHLGTDAVDAPCAEATGLRAASSTVALVCDGAAYVRSGNAWAPLVESGATAVAVRSGAVTVAHTSDDCAGLALTRFTDAAAGGSKGTSVGCAEGADPASPVALAPLNDTSFIVWSGSELITVKGS